MVKIGNVDIHGPLVLAPMAGVTDAPFRALCRAQAEESASNLKSSHETGEFHV